MMFDHLIELGGPDCNGLSVRRFHQAKGGAARVHVRNFVEVRADRIEQKVSTSSINGLSTFYN